MPSQDSAAAQNPYESPAVAGGYFSEELAGIGVWRDGNNLVMHQGAHLPSVCIKTGQAAERFWPVKLRWYYPIDWSTRRLRVELPFCEAGYREFRRKRLMGTAIAVGGVAIMVATHFLPSIAVPQFVITLLIMCGLVGGALLRSPPLKFVRVRGDYLWFSGAGSEFLARLPDWTFGH